MAPNQENIEAKLCAYVDDELTAQERIEIEQHLAANPHHRRLLRELAQTRNLLRSLPRAQSPADLVEGFQSQLERSALLNDEPSEPSGVLLRINRRPQMLSAAAIVLLAVGLAVVIYRTLPSTGPHPEVAVGPSETTPGLVTTDESGVIDSRHSDKASESPTQPGRGDTHKELASGSLPSGGGGGLGGRSGGASSGSMGDSEISRDSEFHGKGGAPSAPRPAGKPLAGPEDVLAAKNKLAKQNSGRNAGDAANAPVRDLNAATGPLAAIASNGDAPNGVAQNGSNQKADDEAPVIVVVNTTNLTLTNGDVSSYLQQNKIAYSAAENETAPLPASAIGHEKANASDPGPIAIAPAAPAVLAPAATPTTDLVRQGEGMARRDDVAKQEDAAEDQKKLGWYMGSDGQMHYRAAPQPGGPASEPKAGEIVAAKVSGIGTVSGITNGQGKVSAVTATTRPVRGSELANSYNLNNGTFGNTTSNSVTYRAVMSRRQVVDLNLRLSQREGQSAVVQSDAIVNRAEGNVLVDNMHQNGANLNGNFTSPSPAAGGGLNVSAVGNRSTVDQVAAASAQAGTPAKVAGPEAARRLGTEQEEAKSLPAAVSQSKTSPPVPDSQQGQVKDVDQNAPHPRSMTADQYGGGTRVVGEKNGQQEAPAPNAQVAPPEAKAPAAAERSQQIEQRAAPAEPAMQRQQQRVGPNDAPAQAEAQQVPARPIAGTASMDASQQLLPPVVASASGSQGTAVQSAGVAAIQQFDLDEQPRDVLIVVAAPPITVATPGPTTPSTQPTAAVRAPAPTTIPAAAKSVAPEGK